MPHCRIIFITLILFTYILLQSLFFQEVGHVGEVAIGWSSTPDVIVDTHPIRYDLGNEWSIFRARETRPTEIVTFADTSIPITINSYTSAVPDWPSLTIHRITNDPSLVQIFHIMMGGTLILLSCFIYGRLSLLMPLLLASDWMFLFYKQILGGTELCLQLSSIGLLWVIVHRRSWGWLIFWMALGLQAKITFAFVIVPIMITIGMFRISLPIRHIKRSLVLAGFLMAPIIVSAYHHCSIEEVVRSHDTWHMQWNRIIMAFSGSTAQALREQSMNLWYWMVHPLSFYERIYSLPFSWSWVGWIRILGWILCLSAVSIQIKKQEVRVYTALFVLLILGICFGPKDLHHYAMITPFWAFWLAKILQPKKWSILAVPFVASGILLCGHTDSVLEKIDTPTFTQSQQQQLQNMLKEHNVQRLVTMDYEVYGLLEYRNSGIELIHGWGAISHKRYRALPELIKEANGGHIIVLKSSMPMRYNLHPTVTMLKEAAQKKGLLLEVRTQNTQWILAEVYRSATEEF